jgi:hypothetical protein
MVKNDDAAKHSDYQHAVITIEIMRKIWERSNALLSNMNAQADLLVEQSNLFMKHHNRNGKSTAKNKSDFINFIEIIDCYATQISHFHDLLHSHECSYQVPLAFYKKLRHELVVQVLTDNQRMAIVIDQMSSMKTNDFLFKRWRFELVRLSALDFEPVPC